MKKRFFIPCILFVCSFFLHAHPHVFIDNTVEFIWNGKDLRGAYVQWTFDSAFSSEIINWLDVNHDGKFDDEENRQVYDNAFINLRHYYYYTFMRQGSTRTNPPKVSEFKAMQKKGIMSYRFYIDLSSYKGNELYFAVYDYTYFCDIRYNEDGGIKLTYDPKQVKASFDIIENKDYPVFYDPLSPATDTSIYDRWKPGLQTYYPREIRIRWQSL